MDLTLLDALGRLGRTDLPWYRAGLREGCRQAARINLVNAENARVSTEQLDAACDAYEHMVQQIDGTDRLTVTAYGPPPSHSSIARLRRTLNRDGHDHAAQIEDARGKARYVSICSAPGRMIGSGLATPSVPARRPLSIVIEVDTNPVVNAAETIMRFGKLVPPAGYAPRGTIGQTPGHPIPVQVAAAWMLRWRPK